MVWVTQNRTNLAIKPLVDRILKDGCMSRREHLQLTSAILADQHVSNEERRQINRVLDYIQTGRLRLID